MIVRNKSVALAKDTKMIAGVQQYFAPNNVTITLAGVTLTPAELAAALASRVAALQATTIAIAALSKAVADAKTLLASTQPTFNAIKQVALLMYSHDPDALTVFGIAAKKVAAPMTTEAKLERVAKAKATRLARNTMGPKAKAKVKGAVPGT